MNITGKNLEVLQSALRRALSDCHTDVAHISGDVSLDEDRLLEDDRLLEVSQDMDDITKLLNRCNKELEKNHGS